MAHDGGCLEENYTRLLYGPMPWYCRVMFFIIRRVSCCDVEEFHLNIVNYFTKILKSHDIASELFSFFYVISIFHLTQLKHGRLGICISKKQSSQYRRIWIQKKLHHFRREKAIYITTEPSCSCLYYGCELLVVSITL